MEGTYGVYFGGNQCGKVQVQRQGLYYRFFCRCRLTGEAVCRLRIVFKDAEENLGVVTPVDDGFGLCTRIPVKRFSGTPERFVLAPVHGICQGQFVPIIPEEPFAYIEKLKNAYLVKKEKMTGIWIE